MSPQIICVGVLIACSAALSAIGDISFEHDIVETIGGASGEDDRDRFRDVAGWLLFAGIAGIISQITIVIIRGLFYFEIIQNRYLTYAVLVSFILHSICPVVVISKLCKT